MIDWIKKVNNPKTELFDKILDSSIPFGISILTYHEILQGVRGESEYFKLRDYLSTQIIYRLPPELNFYEYSSKMYAALRWQGKTIRSTVDMLIAMTAIYYDLNLLHNDRDFDILADKFNKLKIWYG